MAEHNEHHDDGHGSGHRGSHGGGHAEGEHEGAPEWLISFADNVMLQMGFFVILFALNMANASGGEGEGEEGGGAPNSAMLDFAIGMRDAFNNPVDLQSTDPDDQLLIQRILEKKGETSAEGAKGKNDKVNSIRPGDYEQICGTVNFSFGSVALSEEAVQSVLAIAKKVKGKRLIVEVRGHVSEREAYQRDDRGMELAFGRAHAVAEALAGVEISWRQMRLVAAGDNQRASANPATSGEERANERVEIILTNEVLSDTVPTTGTLQRD